MLGCVNVCPSLLETNCGKLKRWFPSFPLLKTRLELGTGRAASKSFSTLGAESQPAPAPCQRWSLSQRKYWDFYLQTQIWNGGNFSKIICFFIVQSAESNLQVCFEMIQPTRCTLYLEQVIKLPILAAHLLHRSLSHAPLQAAHTNNFWGFEGSLKEQPVCRIRRRIQ